MDQQEDDTDDQPDDWKSVEDALEESSQLSGLSVNSSTQYSEAIS